MHYIGIGGGTKNPVKLVSKGQNVSYPTTRYYEHVSRVQYSRTKTAVARSLGKKGRKNNVQQQRVENASPKLSSSQIMAMQRNMKSDKRKLNAARETAAAISLGKEGRKNNVQQQRVENASPKLNTSQIMAMQKNIYRDSNRKHRLASNNEKCAIEKT